MFLHIGIRVPLFIPTCFFAGYNLNNPFSGYNKTNHYVTDPLECIIDPSTDPSFDEDENNSSAIFLTSESNRHTK